MERAIELLGSLVVLGGAALETLEVRWLPEHAEHGYGGHELCERVPTLLAVERA